MLYYEPPDQELFDEVKEAAIELWPEIDSDNDKYGYATSKIKAVENMENVYDNFMVIFAMFDINNQKRLSRRISQEAKDALRERMIAGGATPQYYQFLY